MWFSQGNSYLTCVLFNIFVSSSGWCIYWKYFESFKQNSVDWPFAKSAESDKFHDRLFDDRNQRSEEKL